MYSACNRQIIQPVFNFSIIIVSLFDTYNQKLKTMGVLFISITTGVVILVFLLIIFFRRKKTINENLQNHDVLEKKTGEDGGIYD